MRLGGNYKDMNTNINTKKIQIQIQEPASNHCGTWWAMPQKQKSGKYQVAKNANKNTKINKDKIQIQIQIVSVRIGAILAA